MNLTKDEKFYYDLFVAYCEKQKKDWASSMEIKLDNDLSCDKYNGLFTSLITKFLTKLSQKGMLVKKKTDYLVYFSLPNGIDPTPQDDGMPF